MLTVTFGTFLILINNVSLKCAAPLTAAMCLISIVHYFRVECAPLWASVIRTVIYYINIIEFASFWALYLREGR
jgi:uncharacterized membrane protein YvlD (DUF360 family)